jgi:type II secretory pathway pseudopilin PulG
MLMHKLDKTFRRPRRRHFTMLEGIIAIVILAIVIVGGAPFFYYGQLLIARSSVRRRAVEIATDELESAVNDGFSQVSGGVREIELGDTPATLTTTVQDEYLQDARNGYKRVTVSVQWTQGDSDREVSLQTYVSSAAPIH